VTTHLSADGIFESNGQGDELAAADRIIAGLEGTNNELLERLGQVDMMIDQAGWVPIYEYGPDHGLLLSQVKLQARMLRELMVGNPLYKRGSQLRIVYTWGGGVDFSVLNAAGKVIAMPTALRSTLDKPKNKRALFSNTAHEELERAAFTDGNVFLLVDDQAKTVQRVPIDQITADVRDPDDLETIWAFRREWISNPTAGSEGQTLETRWYFTDAYDGRRTTGVKTPDGVQSADKTHTMIHVAFNQQVGWAYGVPDSLAAIAWARLYKEFMVNGFTMTKALAKLAYKLTVPNKDAGTRASAEIARPGQTSGGTGVMTPGMDLSALSSAGKAYDFAAGNVIAAHVAAALEVSVDALLAGGTPNGDANGGALDPTAKLTALMRRRVWDDAFDRIMVALGAQKQVRPVWKDLAEDTIMRLMQAWQIGNLAQVFQREVIQAGMAEVLGVEDPGTLPDLPPVLQPGETPGGSPNDPGTTDTPSTAGKGGGGKNPGGSAGSGQGKSSGTGKAPNDHSTDSK
jgi:hypothetical protein